jgi:2-C-methyl-D-erythritol 4-phosphate cytidylyltransferase
VAGVFVVSATIAGVTTPAAGPGAPVGVLLPAAGSGERLGGGTPKALRPLAGIPLIGHTLRRLAASVRVTHLVVAAPPAAEDTLAELAARYAPRLATVVVPGGATRSESVRRALAALDPAVGIVLVHDAARCLTPPGLLDAVAAVVTPEDPVIVPGLPVVDTIKQVAADGAVVRTVDRVELRAVQTPQGFWRPVLEQAHRGGAEHTDDAGLAEALGVRVRVVPGDERAFKVTRPLDLLLAEALLARDGATDSGTVAR